jgi:hypothetical protein
MKRFITAAAALLYFTIAGLSQAYEGTIEYDKKKQSAIVIDYAFPTEAVENAFAQKMAKMGYKGKEERGMFNKDKGFRIFRSAVISDISDNTMDYIINVERKSRKEKDESTLYLIMNKNGENLMSGSGTVEVTRAKDFLNGMIPAVEESNLELQIRDQEEVITKSEKKLKNLRDDQEDLEKKLKNNQKDQEETQKDIENQKHALEALREKRRA